jgi:cytosine/adenosine deaminase-related metal-dependent hydrolase
VAAGTNGGITAAKPHGLLPISVAFLVEGGLSTVAALASATALAAAACGLADRKGRLRAGYDADLLVVDGASGRRYRHPGPAGGGVRRRAAPGRSSLTNRPGRRDGPGAAGRPRKSGG